MKHPTLSKNQKIMARKKEIVEALEASMAVVPDDIGSLTQDLLRRIRLDIDKMTPRDRADLFCKLLPFVLAKKNEVALDVRLDLQTLMAKYKTIQEQSRE